ncbi:MULTISPECIES: response regulator [unclassified Roseateles]|uniref:response regulator n=1 Tax=unclassified Roseateles TaxID=2626991 RepID=UPI0006F5276C|nr:MULTISPECIES: response regulator [unclassified Roseateles]KQW49543.1 hypothetical protein ASC81_25840 [Pelomonas sp. Root405]KRA75601.1 hypothetical protein ASD88_25825 [Pelomonas sp. Root662]
MLVVDDNDDAAESLAVLLAFDGAEAKVEHDATNIVAVVSEFNPALILLDLELPVVDGFQACHQIRTLKGDGVYIAAITGWSREEDRARSLAAGFDSHLLKPISTPRLEQLCQVALARQRATYAYVNAESRLRKP